MESIDNKIKKIYDLTYNIKKLDFTINYAKNNKITVLNSINLPDIVKNISIDIANEMKNVLSKKGEGHVCYYENKYKLRYMGIGLFDNNEFVASITIGPYITRAIPKILPVQNVPKNLYELLTIVTENQEKSISNIIINLINNDIISITPIGLEKELKKENDIEYTVEDHKMDIYQIRERYKFEKDLLHYVSEGDEKNALDVLIKNQYNTINRFPEQPLRNSKYLALTINTLLRKSIEINNIDPYFIHTISEYFSIKIEMANSSKVIDHLIPSIIKSYCRLVKKYETKKYSLLVSNAINYIKLNFKYEISLASISKELFVHETYLSKKFKKEMGKNISEYINEVRIREAQHILRTTNLKIEDIAYYMGYNDKRYFSKKFKQIIGKTPTKYRNYIE